MKKVHLLILLSLVGCSNDPLSPGLSQLAGSWSSPTAPLSPQGSMVDRLVFQPDGHMEFHVVDRGMYQGQAADQLSFRYVYYGRVRLAQNGFATSPDSSVTEDLFYGPASHVVQRDFGNSPGWPGSAALYNISGDSLVLTYYSYPADAPVLTEMVFHRE